ncbi:MAG: electron transfer flavoprotein subunit alpha [Dehalococcoidia bacterium]
MDEPFYGPEQAAGMWVYLEHDEGEIARVSRELVAKARELATEAATPLTGLLLGHRIANVAAVAATLDLDNVLAVSSPALETFTAEAHAFAVAEVIRQRRPDVFLLGATPYGRDLAGRLAVMLQTGLTADCTGLAIEPGTGLLLGEVSGFGGGILATIKCATRRPQMATVRPGVFADHGRIRQAPALIESVVVDVPESATPVRVRARRKHQGIDLTRAERLVIAGRGVAGDMALVERLAAALGAEVGATRVAVDEGWVGRDRQVGQTGVIVRPELAIVCGASGATQFTVGIDGAGLVIAINQDPEAPIFEQADLCVVDDLFPVVQALVEHLEAEGGS